MDETCEDKELYINGDFAGSYHLPSQSSNKATQLHRDGSEIFSDILAMKAS